MWILDIDMLGPVPTANRVHRMHHHAVGKMRKQWRETAALLTRAVGVEPCDRIRVTAWVEDSDRRRLSDPDAPAPALKPVIDGLVDAGVIPDDGPDYVSSVTYLPPRHMSVKRSALVVCVERDETGPVYPVDRLA